MNPPTWNLAVVAHKLSAPPIHPDRGPYTLTMRECEGSEQMLARLEAISGPETRLHIGWGSFRNLDIVAARKSSYCLLCDINAHQLQLWESVSETLKQAETAAEFCAILPSLVPISPRPRQFSDSMKTWLDGDRQRPQSWLSDESPKRYQYVRYLFASDRVATICLDLIDRAPPDSGKIGRFALLQKELDRARKECGVILDTLYLSNIGYMLAQPDGFFGDVHTTLSQTVDPVATMHRNLRLLDPAAVIRADKLRKDASEENLQWLTELDLTD